MSRRSNMTRDGGKHNYLIIIFGGVEHIMGWGLSTYAMENVPHFIFFNSGSRLRFNILPATHKIERLCSLSVRARCENTSSRSVISIVVASRRTQSTSHACTSLIPINACTCRRRRRCQPPHALASYLATRWKTRFYRRIKQTHVCDAIIKFHSINKCKIPIAIGIEWRIGLKLHNSNVQFISASFLFFLLQPFFALRLMRFYRCLSYTSSGRWHAHKREYYRVYAYCI